MGFINQMRAEGYPVESVIRALREQGVKITARTYRVWRTRPVAARTINDAMVIDVVRDTAWQDVVKPDGSVERRMTSEGLYGRRKMTAYIRRHHVPEASFGAVDRAMRMLGLEGVRRSKGIRTTIFYDGPYRTIADVEYATAGWVDWYNNRRLHGSLGMVSPAEHEADFYKTRKSELIHV